MVWNPFDRANVALQNKLKGELEDLGKNILEVEVIVRSQDESDGDILESRMVWDRTARTVYDVRDEKAVRYAMLFLTSKVISGGR